MAATGITRDAEPWCFCAWCERELAPGQTWCCSEACAAEERKTRAAVERQQWADEVRRRRERDAQFSGGRGE